MPRYSLEDYIDVQTHINRFWQEYPNGRILTYLNSRPEDFEKVVFKAEVFKHREDQWASATGWAAEVAGTPGANQTSWHENCETSAIGRALVNMGYAKNAAERPSRQEMEKVNRGHERIATPNWANEQAPAPRAQSSADGSLISPRQVGFIRALMREKGVSDEVMHTTLLVDYFGKEHLDELTKQQASHYIERLQAMKKADEQGITQEPQRGYEHNQQGYSVPEEPAHLSVERFTN